MVFFLRSKMRTWDGRETLVGRRGAALGAMSAQSGGRAVR